MDIPVSYGERGGERRALLALQVDTAFLPRALPCRRPHEYGMYEIDGYRVDASFDRVVTLSDGERVRLRWIRPADASLLVDGFARLSERSRRMRFFAPLKELPSDVIRYFTQVDGIDHAALVAVSVPDERATGAEVGLGVARFIRSKVDPAAAELAVTVVDDMQRRGLGTLLVATLAVAAMERGVEAFTMNVLWSNERVRRSLVRLGATEWGHLGDVATCSVSTSIIANNSDTCDGRAPVAQASASRNRAENSPRQITLPRHACCTPKKSTRWAPTSTRP